MCGVGTQHVLFRLLQSRKTELDRSGSVGTIHINLSKTYDWIPHFLLIAILETYRLDKIALKCLLNYIIRRNQRAKMLLRRVNGRKHLVEYHKFQFWVSYFLISLLVCFFLFACFHACLIYANLIYTLYFCD